MAMVSFVIIAFKRDSKYCIQERQQVGKYMALSMQRLCSLNAMLIEEHWLLYCHWFQLIANCDTTRHTIHTLSKGKVSFKLLDKISFKC